jgi:hypothetical protein
LALKLEEKFREKAKKNMSKGGKKYHGNQLELIN